MPFCPCVSPSAPIWDRSRSLSRRGIQKRGSPGRVFRQVDGGPCQAGKSPYAGCSIGEAPRNGTGNPWSGRHLLRVRERHAPSRRSLQLRVGDPLFLRGKSPVEIRQGFFVHVKGPVREKSAPYSLEASWSESLHHERIEIFSLRSGNSV